MKLRQIKLAGFKTFVDPTTISLPGQLAGIVGPNGCGKSNIMESVKWVLGSASAKELRGESMESVIFNGTDSRPPISRASVELIFDNAENKASNEWSKYEEISVRRVIEKDKGSNYSINGINVRRKDVADLFYGTGLGSRGYAIIGQNTVSQLVEAKPEDLKSFLEEAAGISKYKERRKETEYRLRDTRENLQRVKDLEKEINNAILKLEAQAEAAKKANSLQEDLKLLEAKLAFVLKQTALENWQASGSELKHLEIQVEQKKAELTKAELAVEDGRDLLREKNESINPVQTQFYEISSKVSSTESKIQSNISEEERLRGIINQGTQRLADIDKELNRLNELVASLNNELESYQSKLNDFDNTYEDKKNKFTEAQNEFSQIEKSSLKFNQEFIEKKEKLNLDKNTLVFINNKIQDFDNRIAQFTSQLEQQQLIIADIDDTNETQIDQLRIESKELMDLVTNKKNLISEFEQEFDELNDKKQDIQSDLSDAQAEVKTLTNLIDSQSNQSKVSEWLESNQIDSNLNILKIIDIDRKWSSALDSALGVKSNAFFSGTKETSDQPPYSITLLKDSDDAISFTSNPKLKSLTSYIKIIHESYKTSIYEALAGIYVLENKVDLDSLRKYLTPGEVLVDQMGNIFGINYEYLIGQKHISIDTFSSKAKLAEQKIQQNDLEQKLSHVKDTLNSLEIKIDESKEDLEITISTRDDIEKKIQEIELKYAKNKHLKITSQERIEQISSELEKIQSEKSLITNDGKVKEESIKNNDGEIHLLNEKLIQINTEKDTKLDVFNQHKLIYEGAEKEKREYQYQTSLLNNKLTDSNERIELLKKEYHSLSESNDQYNLEEFAKRNELLQSELKLFIKEKVLAEEALKEKRDGVASFENSLRELEQNRLILVQELTPLVEKQQSLKLKEQQTKIDFDYAAKEFSKFGLENDFSENDLKDETNESLTEKIAKTQIKIERIGPINMAAVSELTAEKERIEYITNQVNDLMEASSTLENAIGKIDRETRDKLKETYNQVNENLNIYFRKLFGGGRAVLELLGNEILDTGLQIVAQPPGKKNTTIHLLSGGEKALTAIALVFALFRLNPAPFCLLDEVDAPLDDSNTERFCELVKEMSAQTQFLYVSHNKITMELADQLIGVTMQESGVSRIVEVDLNDVREKEEA